MSTPLSWRPTPNRPRTAPATRHPTDEHVEHRLCCRFHGIEALRGGLPHATKISSAITSECSSQINDAAGLSPLAPSGDQMLSGQSRYNMLGLLGPKSHALYRCRAIRFRAVASLGGGRRTAGGLTNSAHRGQRPQRQGQSAAVRAAGACPKPMARAGHSRQQPQDRQLRSQRQPAAAQARSARLKPPP